MVPNREPSELAIPSTVGQTVSLNNSRDSVMGTAVSSNDLEDCDSHRSLTESPELLKDTVIVFCSAQKAILLIGAG